MSYWIDDTSDRDPTSRRVLDYIMDTPDDLAALPGINRKGTPQPDDSTLHLPVEKGSTAFCISNSSIYMLNSSDQWKML